MQIEVGPNENSLLQAITRLREAVEVYDSAVRELRNANAAFEDAQEAIMPKIPDIPAEVQF